MKGGALVRRDLDRDAKPTARLDQASMKGGAHARRENYVFGQGTLCAYMPR
jgi:hypothetical protein